MKAEFFYKSDNAPTPNKPIHLGVAGILKYKEQVLMEYRSDCSRWSLIGGGLDLNESLEECLIREVKEETSLDISNYRLFNVFSDPTRIIKYPDGNVIRSVTATYIVPLDNILALEKSSESIQLSFFSHDQLLELDIVETHRHIIEAYLASL